MEQLPHVVSWAPPYQRLRGRRPARSRRTAQLVTIFTIPLVATSEARFRSRDEGGRRDLDRGAEARRRRGGRDCSAGRAHPYPTEAHRALHRAVLEVGGRQEVGHGGHRLMLMGFVLAHMVGNLKVYPRVGGDQPLRRVAPRRSACRSCPARSCCGSCASGSSSRSSSTSTPRTRSPGSTTGRARRSTSRHATTSPPTSRRARCGGPASSSASSSSST